MTLFWELLGALLAALGLIFLLWLILGWLLRPAGACPVRAVVTARGGGEGLEQTVRALLWLRSSGLWRGRVVIEDQGLDAGGLALARKLAQRRGVELWAGPGESAKS